MGAIYAAAFSAFIIPKPVSPHKRGSVKRQEENLNSVQEKSLHSKSAFVKNTITKPSEALTSARETASCLFVATHCSVYVLSCRILLYQPLTLATFFGDFVLIKALVGFNNANSIADIRRTTTKVIDADNLE